MLLRTRYPAFNSSDIDDVMIIALARLWIARGRHLPERSSLKTNFFRIADNVARDVLKSGWCRARALEVPLDDGQAAAISWRESDDALAEPPADTQLHHRLREIIDGLPDAYRTIVLADACAPGRVASAEMLAQELQLPPKTVRVYRSRAMNAIRVALRKLGYEVP
jgi:RNA polymerase sigma factor (sigma-70 family)